MNVYPVLVGFVNVPYVDAYVTVLLDTADPPFESNETVYVFAVHLA